MYHPTTRVLTVLELLQSRERLSGPELAARLEVNARTARRYITMLQDMGIPIEAERGRYGAYRLRPGFKLPPLMLSDEEALAVTLGLLAARRLGLAVAAPAVEGALAKIERVLPPRLREQLQAVQASLVLDLARSEASPSSQLVVEMSGAAQAGRRVWIRYRNDRGDETERQIDPYGLVFRQGRWYAVGHCHLRGAQRMFRLDRVAELRVEDERFTRPEGFDTAAFVVQSLATMPNIWEVEVLLQTTLDDARRRVSPIFGTLEDVEGGVLLRAHGDHLSWMARELVATGLHLAVRKPAALREELRQLALRVMAMAEGA
ncbi:MAG: YafY family transcriptional regulator [Chloroflexales bacterium]|nr:YafY family transcriptional regulator [Chloroflexales bacterium]